MPGTDLFVDWFVLSMYNDITRFHRLVILKNSIYRSSLSLFALVAVYIHKSDMWHLYVFEDGRWYALGIYEESNL